MASYKETLLLLCVCISLFLFVPIKIGAPQNDFDQFLTRYNKSYNASEYNRRLEIFKKSKGLIEKYNQYSDNNLSALYGVTEFTDLIPETLLSNLFHEKNLKVQKHRMIWSPKLKIPIRVDWRDKGVISDVKNQRDCGACYAFTTIENIESINAIKTRKLRTYSVQQMIDCSVVNNGCSGGDVCLLLEWIMFNNISILPEEDYPLRLATEQCRAVNSSGGINIKKYKCQNLVNREEIILEHLANAGPVVAAVNSAPWHYYLEGIVQYHCDGTSGRLNHAVQIVGYDMSGRIPFYIARNSWGNQFGMDGYIKIAIGSNMCGIANKVATISV